MWIEATTLGDLVDRTAEWRGDHEALVFPDARVRYAELAGLIDGYARSLRALGVGPGDHVGILMPNRLEFVLALFGAAKLGAVVVPVNGRFKSHELGHVVAHADLRTLVVASGPPDTPDYPAMVAELFPEASGQDPRALALDGGAAPPAGRRPRLGGAAAGPPRGRRVRGGRRGGRPRRGAARCRPGCGSGTWAS